MKELRQIPNIILTAEIDAIHIITEREFDNYFRTFKKPEETLEYNSFCSPAYKNGITCPMPADYGSRKYLINEIVNDIGFAYCLSLYLAYDFRFAPVNVEYFTNNDFDFVKEVLHKSLAGTNLKLYFVVSHFTQLRNNSIEGLKPEHYHILISQVKELDDVEYDIAINIFIENLKRNCQANNLDIIFEGK